MNNLLSSSLIFHCDLYISLLFMTSCLFVLFHYYMELPINVIQLLNGYSLTETFSSLQSPSLIKIIKMPLVYFSNLILFQTWRPRGRLRTQWPLLFWPYGLPYHPDGPERGGTVNAPCRAQREQHVDSGGGHWETPQTPRHRKVGSVRRKLGFRVVSSLFWDPPW